jgi:peptide/nickel transport system ATP-binding protein/oligopeptide transport system ATP-binding protein
VTEQPPIDPTTVDPTSIDTSAPVRDRAPVDAASHQRLLTIDDLSVTFGTDEGKVKAVSDVSLDINRGEIVALVGESGSGKSVTSTTLLGLTRDRYTTIEGSAKLGDLELLTASNRQLQGVRGKRIAMIFQDPMSSLNPVHKIGKQIAEQIRAHESVSKKDAKARAIELMATVGIPRAAERVDSYPHEFSGGMRQRVMIAMALSCSPELLIADEPTTALDVTVQAQILELILKLREEIGMSVLLVTHDLGVVAQTADRVAVMYGGRIVEQAPVEELFDDPRHPYTWGLIGSIPPLSGDRLLRLPAIAGAPPSPKQLPSGCPFAPRCPHVHEHCKELPPLVAADPATPTHTDRCWLELDDKRSRRVTENGSIGLTSAIVKDAA